MGTIRPAMASDVAAVRRIVDAAYAIYIPRIGKPPGPMLDDYTRRIAARQVWVAEEADCITGILVLEQRLDGLVLDNIATDPGWQGKGIGRGLLLFAEAEAIRRGCDELRLYTHALMTENQALYRRIGFVEIGRVQEKGFDRVYMAKQLGLGA